MHDDVHLITRLKNRDSDAFAWTFETYSDRIYRLAVSLLEDEQAADGVVQDTFLALIESIDRFEGKSSIGTWLYRVAYNNAAGHLRKLRPQLSLDDDSDGLTMPTELVNWAEIPDDILQGHEALTYIEQAVEMLNPALRSVFLLRDIDELSTEACAHVLGISESAVKVRLHRARLALRETLATYFDERMSIVRGNG